MKYTPATGGQCASRRLRQRAIALALILGLLPFAAGRSQHHAPFLPANFMFEIRDADRGTPLPGKLVFLQADTLPALDVPSHGLVASRRNTIYTADGRGEVYIPPGRYEVWAGRGTEYSADVQQVAIAPGQKYAFTASIRRVVQTPGYLCGDMHLHTLTFSGHGDATVDERIISCIGEGLEWAVATDHNHITDYAPYSRKLGVSNRLATTVGNEITTPIGHFNAYPLPPDSPRTPYDLRDARKLFRLIRDIPGEVVLQVNHPRWPGGDYFTVFDLDPAFSLSDTPGWSWDFDAFEILNENRGLGWKAEPDSPISVKQDWFNLLNAGYRFAAVGNSDSHEVRRLLAGVPRNYIACSADDPADADEAELVRSIKQKNLAVSRGLYVELSANSGAPIGSQILLDRGRVTFHIRVQAPAWIACDTVQVIGNGEVVRTFPVPASPQPVRFLRDVTLTPAQDTWYVVVATGTKSMAPLIHNAPVPITPLGFTNPIWVDADGDGHFAPLLERAGRLVQRFGSAPQKLIGKLQQAPGLFRYAIRYLAASPHPRTVPLLGALLAPASLSERLFIYKMLGKTGGAEARDILARTAATLAVSPDPAPLEQLGVALARVRAGETSQWPAALAAAHLVRDVRYLRAAFKPMRPGVALSGWHSAGPFPFAAEHGLDWPGPPESGMDLDATYSGADSADVRWRPVPPSAGAIDFVQLYGKREYVNAYAYTEFTSHRAGDMLFLLGSDDGVAVWLNGREVHRHHVHRGVTPGDDVLVLPVAAGRNTLLVKVENGGGGWGFILEPIDVLGWLR